jgi:hypothetical protein
MEMMRKISDKLGCDATRNPHWCHNKSIKKVSKEGMTWV